MVQGRKQAPRADIEGISSEVDPPKQVKEKDKLSCKDIVTGNREVTIGVVQMKPIATPCIEGGNMVVEVDKDNYRKGMEELI